VLLDGIERSYVLTADEERRELVRYVADSAGRFVVDLKTREPLRETLYGTVVILMEPWAERIVRHLQRQDDVPRSSEPRGAHHLLRLDAGRADAPR
jgi:hypothetical protein